jgi:light-regulated signal transduction histidine kinase (bacteriophytochrome)
LQFDEKGKNYLIRICNSAAKMGGIIDDLLRLSRVSRQEMQLEMVDLSRLVSNIVAELCEADAGRNVRAVIQEGLIVHAARRLMEVTFSNLVRNAWEYTSKTENACFEFVVSEENGQSVYHLRDNGAGFDQKLAGRTFWPFH